MILIVFFIFCAVIMGAARCCRRLPDEQPRIGFSCRAGAGLIARRRVFYGTAAVGIRWSSINAFLLVIGIFLGGTLNYGQKRAEAIGESYPMLTGLAGAVRPARLVAAFALYLVIAVFFAVPDPRSVRRGTDQHGQSEPLYHAHRPSRRRVLSDVQWARQCAMCSAMSVVWPEGVGWLTISARNSG